MKRISYIHFIAPRWARQTLKNMIQERDEVTVEGLGKKRVWKGKTRKTSRHMELQGCNFHADFGYGSDVFASRVLLGIARLCDSYPWPRGIAIWIEDEESPTVLATPQEVERFVYS